MPAARCASRLAKHDEEVIAPRAKTRPAAHEIVELLEARDEARVPPGKPLQIRRRHQQPKRAKRDALGMSDMPVPFLLAWIQQESGGLLSGASNERETERISR